MYASFFHFDRCIGHFTASKYGSTEPFNEKTAFFPFGHKKESRAMFRATASKIVRVFLQNNLQRLCLKNLNSRQQFRQQLRAKFCNFVGNFAGTLQQFRQQLRAKFCNFVGNFAGTLQ
jgi:hypothetical protein